MFKSSRNTASLRIGVVSLLAFFITSCGHDHDHGAVTTIRMQLTDVTNSSNVVTATATDRDGPGGNPPTIDTLRVREGVTYNGTFFLRNDNDNEDLTGEIRGEANTHQFVFTPGTTRLVFSNLSTDRNGAVFGMDFRVQVTTGDPVTSSLRVELRHWDGGNKSGPFDTDVDVTFPVVISSSAIIRETQTIAGE